MDAGTTLVLAIPVLALATGFVAVLKLPRSAFEKKPEREQSAEVDALEEEVERLRDELAATKERLQFTERLLETPPERRLPGDDPSTS